jgi:16S rRNA (cytosine1402-N4)-methyltransferase
MDGYHIPVLLQDVLDGLSVHPDGTYVDVTYGGGGHTKALLALLSPKGRVVAFDQDDDALAQRADDSRLILVKSNFRFFYQHLQYLGLAPVDGILADLGVSSHQFDTPERGFSIRFDATLDMRMNRDQKPSALTVLNEYSEEKLVEIFRNYGELEKSHRLAKVVVAFRSTQKLTTTEQLSALVVQVYGQQNKNQQLAKVFQAIRIEVNAELEVLQDFLQTSLPALKPGGRLAVISYHSLEDRLVKNFLRSGTFDGNDESDVFGNRYRPFRLITKKALAPTEQEILQNPRSRSARLRIGEKTDDKSGN